MEEKVLTDKKRGMRTLVICVACVRNLGSDIAVGRDDCSGIGRVYSQLDPPDGP